jgi:hypothetical protein
VLLAIALVAIILEAGCGSSAPVRQPSWTPPRPTPDQASQPTSEIDRHMTDGTHACAARSAEATVRAQMIDRGAALVFTAQDDVGALRERVSALSVPAFLLSSHRRIDKIHDGVRLVFEAEGSQKVEAVQQDVVRHAREMAKTCGLVLAAPTDWSIEQQERAESSASAAGPSRRSEKRSMAAAQPARPNTDKPKEKMQAGASPKPEAKPKAAPAPAPKPADKPNEKPPQPLKPREDKKPEIPRLPRVPRLPGPRPNPFAASESWHMQVLSSSPFNWDPMPRHLRRSECARGATFA